jgi:hypothetical protein
MGNTMKNQTEELDYMEVYKYLGVEESHNIEYKNVIEELNKLYIRRLKLILNTKPKAKKKMQEIGTLAELVSSYSFGIINWHKKYKIWTRNKVNGNHTWTASPKSRH